MTMTDDHRDDHPLGAPAPARTARDTVNQMLDAGLLDDVMARAGEGELALTGEGGFLPEMIKAVLERGLSAELTEHLGYERGDPDGCGSGNSRNGTTPKTVASEVGDLGLDVPRDRAGSFDPRLVPKGSRRIGGLDEMIISLRAAVTGRRSEPGWRGGVGGGVPGERERRRSPAPDLLPARVGGGVTDRVQWVVGVEVGVGQGFRPYDEHRNQVAAGMDLRDSGLLGRVHRCPSAWTPASTLAEVARTPASSRSRTALASTAPAVSPAVSPRITDLRADAP